MSYIKLFLCRTRRTLCHVSWTMNSTKKMATLTSLWQIDWEEALRRKRNQSRKRSHENHENQKTHPKRNLRPKRYVWENIITPWRTRVVFRVTACLNCGPTRYFLRYCHPVYCSYSTSILYFPTTDLEHWNCAFQGGKKRNPWSSDSEASGGSDISDYQQFSDSDEDAGVSKPVIPRETTSRRGAGTCHLVTLTLLSWCD